MEFALLYQNVSNKHSKYPMNHSTKYDQTKFHYDKYSFNEYNSNY